MNLIFREYGERNSLFSYYGEPANYSKGDMVVFEGCVYVVARNGHYFKYDEFSESVKPTTVIVLELVESQD